MYLSQKQFEIYLYLQLEKISITIFSFYIRKNLFFKYKE
jgi:hypothetical protein